MYDFFMICKENWDIDKLPGVNKWINVRGTLDFNFLKSFYSVNKNNSFN